MNDRLRRTQQRATAYWFVDGLAEMAMGLIALLIAFVFWFWQALFTGRWSFLIVFGILLVLAVGIRLMMHKIKERSTYPRTGYVAPITGFESRAAAVGPVIFVLLVLGLNYLISTSGPEALLWSPGLAGLIFAFVLAWNGFTTGLRRLYLPAAVAGVMGVLVSLLGLDYFKGVGLLSAVVGLVTLAQGLRVYRAYHSQHPADGLQPHG